MPRPALCCTVKLRIKQITCPGTLHLTDRNLVFLSVSALAQTKRTKSVFASFPFVYNEKLVFERVFTNSSTLEHVLEILEDEIVSIELRQYSSRYDDGKILARFEQSARQFLFPGPTFVPKDDIRREILLSRTPNFSVERGIDPKMDFYTTTKIEEITIASHPREHLTSTHQTKQRKSQSPAFNAPSSSSDTEEEVIITTPRRGRRPQSSPSNLQHCICECPFRPENNGKVVIRSRSVSPGRDTATSFHKPPFRTGKAPENLISKRDFEATNLQKTSPVRDENFGLCSNCVVPHPNCNLCMAYKQTYGHNFVKYRFPKDKNKRSPKTPHSQGNTNYQDIYNRDSTSPRHKVKNRGRIPKVRARIPLSSPESNSEDDDNYRAALKVSSNRKRTQPNLFVKHELNDSLSSRESRMRRSRTGEDVRSTVKKLLEKNDSVLRYELSHSDESGSDLSDYDRFHVNGSPLMTSSINSKSVPDRSVVVPLSNERYWSQKTQDYSNKSHRQIFNESLGEIYRDIYNKTIDSD